MPTNFKLTGREAVRGGDVTVTLILLAALLAAGNVSACGLHGGFGFSPFGMSSNRPAPQPLPSGTSLTVPSLVSVAADTNSTITITFSVPAAFADPWLSIDAPQNVRFDGALQQPVAVGDSSLDLPFVAAVGHHRLTVRLNGTFDGRVMSVVRQAYLLAQPTADLATR